MDRNTQKIFQILPFYNTFIERLKIKKLSNVELLKELPFYDELSIVKNNSAFSGYAKGYKIEIIGRKDSLVQLRASELSIKNLFKDFLDEIKAFKYQITLSVLLSKIKSDGNVEYQEALLKEYIINT